MPINFMPKEVKFFDYLNMQAENIVKAADCFKISVKKGPFDEETVKKIKNFEHEGDTLSHEIVDMLNRTFITPIDREDIYALANTLDDILDMINSMSNRIKLYKLDASDEHMVLFADTIDQSTQALANAVKHMHDTKRARRVLDYCIEVNRLENMGDQIREKAISRLFETEKDPIMVIKWKEIYEVAEGTLDTCEHVAKVIEAILVKHG
jgi:predicted phosphate transport protein (TIGR00153 family)